MTGFAAYQVEISRTAYNEILDNLRANGIRFFPLNYDGPIDLDGLAIVGSRKDSDHGNDEHDRRVTELLEANNRYLDRARKAERDFAGAKHALGAATKLIASMVKLGESE